MPLSPSFPDWLLKRDPTLAGALTNPIFLAFEERRMRRRREAKLAVYRIPAAIGLVVLLAAGLHRSGITGSGFDPWILLFLLGILGTQWDLIREAPSIIKRWRAKAQSGAASVLPTELRHAIKYGIPEPLANDLAMLPYPTSLLFEALILEDRRNDLRFAVLTAIAGSGFWVAATAYGMAKAGQWPTVVDGAILCALILAMPAIAPAVYWGFAGASLGKMHFRLSILNRSGVPLFTAPSLFKGTNNVTNLVAFVPCWAFLIGVPLGSAEAGWKWFFVAACAATAFVSTVVSRGWRRDFAEAFGALNQVRPENLADLLFDTHSAADRAFD